MAKRKTPTTPAEQAAQFQRSAQGMIDAGELNPTAAEGALDALVRQARKPKESEDG